EAQPRGAKLEAEEGPGIHQRLESDAPLVDRPGAGAAGGGRRPSSRAARPRDDDHRGQVPNGLRVLPRLPRRGDPGRGSSLRVSGRRGFGGAGSPARKRPSRAGGTAAAPTAPQLGAGAWVFALGSSGGALGRLRASTAGDAMTALDVKSPDRVAIRASCLERETGLEPATLSLGS